MLQSHKQTLTNGTYKYIFGPLPSRRLGRSVGVDIIPKKLCNLDCIYCEVGQTDKRAMRRREYVPTRSVLEEIQLKLHEGERIDFITFSGSGEPTLNSKLGEMIRFVKEMTSIPVAVITNGTLLFLEEVRRDLLLADVVLPSLDAATQSTFERINQPHPSLNIKTTIEGLKRFREEYAGQLWLEVLLVAGYNDSDEELAALKHAIQQIEPDRIQLNTVVRPPSDRSANPLKEHRMDEIKQFFGRHCEIIGTSTSEAGASSSVVNSSLLIGLLHRRAMTKEELAGSMNLSASAVSAALEALEDDGLVVSFSHDQKTYFRATELMMS
jgi:wyosine [tRNA(Phe)-imidazoG37] synthetase (radical SAM superfamily)